MHIECSSKILLIVATCILCLLFILVAVSTFLYRNRLEIKYCFLHLVWKRKTYEELVDLDKEYTYDSFIAYSQPDYPWVRDHLAVELEQRSGITLCLHNRDFRPGTRIQENVMEAVHGSRKVIMVLSSTFLDSEWCELELEVAQMRSFDERRELIIPIVLEDLPVHKMSRNMRHLLRRNTYLEWPVNPQQLETFGQT